MKERDSVQSVLLLRKLTRAITDVARAQMTEYLATLTPLLQPRTILGDYVQGGPKESSRRAEKAFKDLQALYETVAPSKPFHLPKDLTPPLNFGATGLEITPLDYAHVAQSGADSRTITVRSPLTWVLTYTGFTPSRLQELLNTKMRSGEELQRFVLSYLVMHVVTTSQPGLLQMFEALRFPITTAKVPEFGELPITRIGATVSTGRPSDAVVIESAELTGMDAFEEVVEVGDISGMRDPWKDRLLEVARQHVPDLVTG
jgi:hypothetical protein